MHYIENSRIENIEYFGLVFYLDSFQQCSSIMLITLPSSLPSLAGDAAKVNK